MNLELFNKLARRKYMPSQAKLTWQLFLELCELYLTKWEIENPVVVELGVRTNHQKRFYEQLLNAEHIGIDISDTEGKPDILGDTRDPQTLQELFKMLYRRPVDILFIDADHSYEAVKSDFGMYSFLCNGIVAFDDINLSRHKKRNRFNHGVCNFWDELKVSEEYKDMLFISTHQRRESDGIGMIIKR